MTGTTSVLMAEAAALALAASVLSSLNISRPNFLMDNQQLVTFLNGQDHASPPLWDIKPYTQRFINANSTMHGKVYKIPRKLNVIAHILASQAVNSTSLLPLDDRISCTSQHHVTECPLRVALNSVPWEAFSLIAASCC
jgi:hypothetical protein